MNKTAFITGASKRIGKSLAEHLSEKGWNVAVHYNHSEKPADEFGEAIVQKYIQAKNSWLLRLIWLN